MTRFPGLAENASFRKRVLQLDEDHHPKVKRMARHGESWLRRCLNNERKHGLQLVISGTTGCGKTHVAERIYGCFRSWAVDACFTVGWNCKFPWSRFVDWSEIADADKQAAYDYEVECVKGAKVIVIDDVGSESDKYKSGGPAARLRHILSLCDGKWLLLTTNLPKTEFFKRYDARCADRLSTAHWCDLSGVPSYRPKLQA